MAEFELLNPRLLSAQTLTLSFEIAKSLPVTTDSPSGCSLDEIKMLIPLGNGDAFFKSLKKTEKKLTSWNMSSPHLLSLNSEKTNPTFGKMESFGFPVWLHIISLNLNRFCLGQLKHQERKKA